MLTDNRNIATKVPKMNQNQKKELLVFNYLNKGDLYMKATGIVRRIEECVIIGQKSKKPHKH